MIIRNTEHDIYIMDHIALFRVLDDTRRKTEMSILSENTMKMSIHTMKKQNPHIVYMTLL